MPSLPIDAVKSAFHAALETANVLVQSPTGSGKSTRLPLWCMNRGRVLVVEPRRMACRSLAGYVARCHGTPMGENIGYAIRFENQCSPNSQIVFCTPGVALRWLVQNRLREFGVVLLDEFHERRWDTGLRRNRAAHTKNRPGRYTGISARTW